MSEENKKLTGTISPLEVYHTDAYAIAVANGFEGTIEEWLESLKGEKGDDYVLTDADKEEITQAVLAALPDLDGVAY